MRHAGAQSPGLRTNGCSTFGPAAWWKMRPRETQADQSAITHAQCCIAPRGRTRIWYRYFPSLLTANADVPDTPHHALCTMRVARLVARFGLGIALQLMTRLRLNQFPGFRAQTEFSFGNQWSSPLGSMINHILGTSCRHSLEVQDSMFHLPNFHFVIGKKLRFKTCFFYCLAWRPATFLAVTLFFVPTLICTLAQVYDVLGLGLITQFSLVIFEKQTFNFIVRLIFAFCATIDCYNVATVIVVSGWTHYPITSWAHS